MPCFSPITGYRARVINPETGKRSLVFNATDGFLDMPVTVPCGKCSGCRLDYSRQWAVRCVHEAQMHEANSFITLTYRDECLPEDRSVSKRELQLFFKKLRKAVGKIRYFACGEYGDKNRRSHYHAIVFGYDFPDKRLYSKRLGNLYYRSELLESLWDKGFSTIGHVSFESAAYVARYVMKKRKPGSTEEQEEENRRHYEVVDEETGEVFQIEPEFCLMSRNKGIGYEWVRKYHGDTDKDFVTVHGVKMSLPKYYDKVLEDLGKDIETRKYKRKSFIDPKDNTLERLAVKEKVKAAQLGMLVREMESNG